MNIDEINNKFSGDLGVWACNIEDQHEQFFNEDDVFTSASIIKIPIVVTLFKLAQYNEVDLNSYVNIENRVPGNGVLKDLSDKVKITLFDLAVLSITISDNTAANMLIDIIGIETINSSMSSFGYNQIILKNKFFDVKENNEFSTITPKQTGQLINSVLKREILNDHYSNQLIEILKRQQYKQNLNRYLPYSSCLIASKSGSYIGVRNEVGILWSNESNFVFAILTKNCKDEKYLLDNEGSITVSKTIRYLYDSFKKDRSKIK